MNSLGLSSIDTGTDVGDSPFLRVCERHENDPARLIEILHNIQNECGWISDDAITVVAHALNRTRAEIIGVVSFYHDFARSKPRGRAVHLCRAEACQAMGCDDLVAHAEKSLGLRIDESGNGVVALRSAYCLGNCALAPAIMIDRQLYGRVTPEVFDSVLADEEGT